MNSSWELLLARTQTRVTSDQDCSLLRHVHWLVCMLSGPVALVYTRLMKTHLPTLPCNREVLMGLWSQTTLEQVCTLLHKVLLTCSWSEASPRAWNSWKIFFLPFLMLDELFLSSNQNTKKGKKTKTTKEGRKKRVISFVGTWCLWPPSPAPPKKNVLTKVLEV